MTNNSNLPTKEERHEWRRQRFAVQIEPTEHPITSGQIDLRVTHNGNHWHVISLTPEEQRIVMEALARELAEAAPKNGTP